MKTTAETRFRHGLEGEELFRQRARQALPVLVRQAKAEQPVFYSDLAEELEMPNPRNLNYVLGTIGATLRELSNHWNQEVPPIQALVVNKATGLPGEGFASFAPDSHAFRKASTKQRREIVNAMLSKVYSFDQWDRVLHYFGLQPLGRSMSNAVRPRRSLGDLGHGESMEHRALKEFIAHNPQALGLPKSCAPGEIEYLFGSADAIDVLFQNGDEWIGVEVKAARSAIEDIARGLFQCVKYQALLEAAQKVEQIPINCRVILALEQELPRELVALRNTLSVEVHPRVRSR